jgi:hypothetical protein
MQQFRPDFYSVFYSVFWRQLASFIANKILIITSIFLFVASFLIFSFMSEGALNIRMLKILEILLIIYSITLSSDLVIVEDYKKGVFEQFILSGVVLEYFVLAKTLATLCAYLMLYLPVLISLELIISGSIIHNFWYTLSLKALILSNITINALLSSSFLLSHKKRISQILISILINIPVFIISTICYKSADLYHLMILIAIFLINISLSIVVSSYLIKTSIEES